MRFKAIDFVKIDGKLTTAGKVFDAWVRVKLAANETSDLPPVAMTYAAQCLAPEPTLRPAEFFRRYKDSCTQTLPEIERDAYAREERQAARRMSESVALTETVDAPFEEAE